MRNMLWLRDTVKKIVFSFLRKEHIVSKSPEAHNDRHLLFMSPKHKCGGMVTSLYKNYLVVVRY